MAWSPTKLFLFIIWSFLEIFGKKLPTTSGFQGNKPHFLNPFINTLVVSLSWRASFSRGQKCLLFKVSPWCSILQVLTFSFHPVFIVLKTSTSIGSNKYCLVGIKCNQNDLVFRAELTKVIWHMRSMSINKNNIGNWIFFSVHGKKYSLCSNRMCLKSSVHFPMYRFPILLETLVLVQPVSFNI